MREEQTRDRSRRARDRRAPGTRPALGGCARARPGAPAGRRGRAARRVQRLRLQPAAVAGAAGRRPGHPDVGAAVPGGLPDRRLPRPGRHRRPGQRRPGPVPDRRPGPLSRLPPSCCPWASSPPRGPRPPRRRPTRCSRCGRGARCCPSARRTPPGRCCAAVPVARRRGRGGQRRGRGLVAVRRPRAGRGAPAGPARPGGPAGRDRPVPGLRRVPRVRARGRLPVRRRAARRDRRRHLPGLARVLHQRHRLLPAQSRAGRLRTDLGGLYFNLVFMLALAGLYAATSDRAPAPGHRPHAPGDAGAADAVRPLRRLFHPQ